VGGSTKTVPALWVQIACVSLLQVHRIELATPEGFSVSFTTYGATLLSVRSGDKDGNIEEVKGSLFTSLVSYGRHGSQHACT